MDNLVQENRPSMENQVADPSSTDTKYYPRTMMACQQAVLPRRAIILSAGQGRRLLPMTEIIPKCALRISGQAIIEWQIDMLLDAGIPAVTAVLGHGADHVKQLLAKRYDEARVQTLFNPFFRITDNLASCWIAREAMEDDFILLNGDTLFEPRVLECLLQSPKMPITLAVDHKAAYDNDDMKVHLRGTRLLRVGKSLPATMANAESIGMLYFRERGPEYFRVAVENALRRPEALQQWYLSVIDRLADEQIVGSCSIAGLRWAELDFPSDLPHVEAVLAELPQAVGNLAYG